MSLILDALKKMEQDKARHQKKSVDIGHGILQERHSNTSARWRAPALVTAIVIVTAVSTILLMTVVSPGRNAKQPSAVAVERPAAPPVTEPATPPLPPHQATAEPPPSVIQAPVATPSRPPVSEPTPAPSSPPGLNVTGIAWQEERNARRAVVNGVLVAEGAMVAGARVQEIRPEAVRFVFAGQTLEILNSSPFH